MPSFDTYKQMMSQRGKTSGQMKQQQSKVIIDTTWNEDTQSRVCYLYDYYHDDEPKKNVGMIPEGSTSKVAIDAKFIIDSYNTMDKDSVAYKLQFRPFQSNPLDYFDEYEKKYGVTYPLSLYVDIPDDDGIYQKWIIVAEGNRYETFQTWLILPCDFLYQWVCTVDGVRRKYEMWGASRSQNS